MALPMWEKQTVESQELWCQPFREVVGNMEYPEEEGLGP